MVDYLERKNKPDLAYIHTKGSGPAIVFLGGFKSDMHGTKAEYFEAQAKAACREYLRLDYSGHGLSYGKFEDGTIGSWAEDARDVIEHLGLRDIILVGSSMGGWISLLLAQRMIGVKAIVGIAAAPDFTKSLYEKHLSPQQREEMNRNGLVKIPNEYSDEPYIFTKALIDDGAENSVLDRDGKIGCPIHLVQGKQDPDVPWETAELIKEKFPQTKITYINDGDHRLSKPDELDIIWRAISENV